MSKRIGRGRRGTSKPRRASRPGGTAAPQRARELPPSDVGSFRNPLVRLPDTLHLARVVPHLAPETLHQIIRHYGLDVCAEIVASATPVPVAFVCDLDLWRSAKPGHDDRFATERFGEWVELLVDAGDTVAARIVAAMDEHLVVAGLSRYIRVFDPAAISTSLDGEPPDIDVSHGGPECEVGGYLVRGIMADAWDAIVALLLALDADHHDRFHAVMRACRRLTNSRPEVDGLDHLRMEPEQLLHDVARDREHRRSQQGYSTPPDARAFLLMARRRRLPSNGEPPVNQLVAAYFRAVTDTLGSENDAVANLPQRALEPPATLEGVPEAVGAVADMLARAGLPAQRPRALLEGTHSQPSRLALIRTLIDSVRDTDDAMYVVRSQELAFLANTLMAGCSIQSRAFTPQEASDAAVGVCNLGLEHWPDSHATSPAGLDAALPDTFLMDHDLVSAFEVGWAVLYENVSMFVAGQLLFGLSNLRCGDADIQKGLDTLRIELTRQREAGTPWRARNALEVIAMLDMPAWVSVLGLLDECPVIPTALMATLEGRTGAISATEFKFIASSSQLGKVREFMARFLDILG